MMQQLNAEAALLKACLQAYTAWLEQQRAAAAVAGAAAPEGGQGPPAGAFSHREAVDAWHLLLQKVVVAGNFFLLQARHLSVGYFLALLAANFVLLRASPPARPAPPLWRRGCLSACRTRWRPWPLTRPKPPSPPPSPLSFLLFFCLPACLQDQVEVMVRWATEQAVTPYDSGGPAAVHSCHPYL